MKVESKSRQKGKYNSPKLELLGKITVVTQKSGDLCDNKPEMFPLKMMGQGTECVADPPEV